MIAVVLILGSLNEEAPLAALAEAAQLYAAGDCAAAAAMYKPIVAAFPDRPGLRLNYARCLAGAGRRGEALLAAAIALHQKPSDWRAWRFWLRLRDEASAPVTTQEWLLWSARLTVSPVGSAAVLVCIIFWWWSQRHATAQRWRHAGLLLLPAIWWLAQLALSAAPVWSSPLLVVTQNAWLRAGNGWSYPPAPWLGQRATITDGTVVRLQHAAANGWVQVASPDGRTGWLPTTVAARLP